MGSLAASRRESVVFPFPLTPNDDDAPWAHPIPSNAKSP